MTLCFGKPAGAQPFLSYPRDLSSLTEKLRREGVFERARLLAAPYVFKIRSGFSRRGSASILKSVYFHHPVRTGVRIKAAGVQRGVKYNRLRSRAHGIRVRFTMKSVPRCVLVLALFFSPLVQVHAQTYDSELNLGI